MRLAKLLTPYFLFALGLLLFNDFFLKSVLHNWFSGKLSDFAGLFVFAFFWSVVFSGKSKWVHILTALLFVWFKSRFSESALDVINSLGVLEITRVVDYWDLLGLSILPVSYYLVKQEAPSVSFNWATVPVAVLSIFSFIATSQPRERTYLKAPQHEEKFGKQLTKKGIEHQFYTERDTLRHNLKYLDNIREVEPVDTSTSTYKIVQDSLVIGDIRKCEVWVPKGDTVLKFVLAYTNRTKNWKAYWGISHEPPLVLKDNVVVDTFAIRDGYHLYYKEREINYNLDELLPFDTKNLTIGYYTDRREGYYDFIPGTMDTLTTTSIRSDMRLDVEYKYRESMKD